MRVALRAERRTLQNRPGRQRLLPVRAGAVHGWASAGAAGSRAAAAAGPSFRLEAGRVRARENGKLRLRALLLPLSTHRPCARLAFLPRLSHFLCRPAVNSARARKAMALLKHAFTVRVWTLQWLMYLHVRIIQ